MATLSRHRAALGSAFILAALATGCGGAADADGLDVDGAWARTTPPGVTTGATYLTLTSDADDTLLGASVDPAVAAAVELHTTTSDGGQATMSALGAVPLAAGEDVVFEPGGAHVMLVDLAAPLVAGTSFELTLELAEGGRRGVDVEVRDQES